MSLEMKVPTVGESITEVTLAQWLKNDGDYVEMDEIVAELESDKATFELPAEKAGILRHVAGEGDTLEIGAIVCTIEEGAKAEDEASAKESSTSQAEEKSSQQPQAPAAQANYATGTASPAAAKILNEKGIDANSRSEERRVGKEWRYR